MVGLGLLELAKIAEKSDISVGATVGEKEGGELNIRLPPFFEFGVSASATGGGEPIRGV